MTSLLLLGVAAGKRMCSSPLFRCFCVHAANADFGTHSSSSPTAVVVATCSPGPLFVRAHVLYVLCAYPAAASLVHTVSTQYPPAGLSRTIFVEIGCAGTCADRLAQVYIPCTCWCDESMVPLLLFHPLAFSPVSFLVLSSVALEPNLHSSSVGERYAVNTLQRAFCAFP